jgi:RimJ/RimL family protein N-acetyltransferase
MRFIRAQVGAWRRARTRADATVIQRTIVADGTVAGYIASWGQDAQRLLAYWIGRDQWGRGIATQALAQFTRQVTARPLHAHVAVRNAGSIRVLEKCGASPLRELARAGQVQRSRGARTDTPASAAAVASRSS